MSGDSNRGSVLVEQYRPLCWAIAREYWWPGAELEDVRQEATIALLEAWPKWDRRGKFSAFARVVIRRHLTDCVRVMRRKVELVELFDNHEEPRSFADQIEARRVLREVLEDRRAALLVAVGAGHSYREIGAAANWTPATTKKAIWRAREPVRLREAA